MIIKQKKLQTLLYAIITFVAFAMFLWFSVWDFRTYPHDYNFWLDNTVVYWIFRGLCIISMIITAAADVWFIKQMFSKNVLVEICDEYFYDNSSAISLGKIAWSDMEKAYVNGGLFNIKLKDPKQYFKKKNWLQLLMIKSNLKLGYGDVCISSQRFKKDAEKFIDEFSKRKTIDH